MLPMLPALLRETALANRLLDAPSFGTTGPAFDCYETQNTWELVLDVPGVAKEDLTISVEPGELTIRGSRKAPEVAEGCAFQVRRWSGEFARTFRLADDLDANKVEASLKEGVLRISVAKAEAAKPREITIA